MSPRPSLSARGSQCPGYCQLEAVGGCLGVCPRQGWCLPAHTPFSHGPFDISWFFLWPPTGQGRAPLLEVPVSSTWPDPDCMHQARILGLRMGHLGRWHWPAGSEGTGGPGQGLRGEGSACLPRARRAGLPAHAESCTQSPQSPSRALAPPSGTTRAGFPTLVGPACSGPCWTPVWPGKAPPPAGKSGSVPAC